jgi:hypothetical protein
MSRSADDLLREAFPSGCCHKAIAFTPVIADDGSGSTMFFCMKCGREVRANFSDMIDLISSPPYDEIGITLDFLIARTIEVYGKVIHKMSNESNKINMDEIDWGPIV